jgi:RNA polymerase sigma factor (sigma-70 family)
MHRDPETDHGVRAKFDDAFCEMLPRLYRRAVMVTGDRQAGEDALQDAYVKLVAQPLRMLDHADPYGYALTTVVNAARDAWRRTRRQVPVADPGTVSWDGGFAMREAELETLRLLAHLTPRQATVLLLVDVDGYTLKLAAMILGVHLGTVARVRTGALKKLRGVFAAVERTSLGDGER